MFSFDDLTRPLTRQQVQDSLYDVLAILGVSTTTWKPGAVLRTFIVVSSVALAAFSRMQAAVARSGWLELAEGEWLTLAAWYLFGVRRERATFATGPVTMQNTGGGIFEFDPEDLVFVNRFNGRTYRNTEPVSLGIGETVTIAVRATEVGTASNAPPGAIDALESPLSGVVVTNPAAVVGTDDESPEQLRTRCYEKRGSLSPNGPKDAYAYAARNARRADGSRIGVTRVKVIRDGTGSVEVVCATASGGVSGAQSDPLTDLGAVHAAVQETSATLTATLTTTTATARPLDISYSLWVYDDIALSDDEIKTKVDKALTDFTTGQPIGGNVIYPDPGKVFLSAIKAVIGGVRPEVFRVVLESPAGDPEFGMREVPTQGAIVCTAIHRQSRNVI